MSLKYEDRDGDMITLTSQNDFEDLLEGESDVVNVLVSENMLPSLSKPQPKVASLWSQGGAPVNWAKDQLMQQRSSSPFTHTPTALGSVRQAGSSRHPERFPHIESPALPTSARSTRWKRGEILGQGAFGVVYLGLNVDSGELMAVKQISNDELKTKELSSLENEISVLRTLKHPNIVRYIGTERNPSTLSIFLEYVPGGSLKSLIDKFGSLEEAVVKSYTRQILLGLEYLHRNGIAHRDIKGANCLVGNDGAVKLADFGASNSWRSSVESEEAAVAVAQNSNSQDVKGTPSWMSPEVIRGEKPLNWKKADVWSLGCTTIEMTTGKPPWNQYSNPVTVLYHIACSETVPEYPEDASVELLTFLNACLQRDPNERTDITSLLLHPFVASMPSQTGPSGATWGTGSWTQRPTTVSTTPAGEWQDSNSQWKGFSMTVNESSLHRTADEPDIKTTRAVVNRSNSIRDDTLTPDIDLSSPNTLDIDLESTVSRSRIVDTASAVRAQSSRNSNTAKKKNHKSSGLSGNLSPLSMQDCKLDDDKQRISDLLSVASLENSIETFPDDLDDSTSTLASGRVILESLDETGSVISQEMVGRTPSATRRNINDVKISPIGDVDDESCSIVSGGIVQVSPKAQSKISRDDINSSVGEESDRKHDGQSPSRSKAARKSKQATASPVRQSGRKSSNSTEKARALKAALVSPVKQPNPTEGDGSTANFTKNLEMKLANSNEKVIEKVIKPLTRIASSGSQSSQSSPTSSLRKKPHPIQTGRAGAIVSKTVLASPIQVASNSRRKRIPYEYSSQPGGDDNNIRNSRIDSLSLKPGITDSSRTTKASEKPYVENEKVVDVFSTSQRSNADEIKDEVEICDDVMKSRGMEDDASIADELSDDSSVNVCHVTDDEGDEEPNNRKTCRITFAAENSISEFEWLSSGVKEDAQFYHNLHDGKSRGKDQWTADAYPKGKKRVERSNSPLKSSSSLSKSKSSPNFDKSSEADIGLYELVGHSFKQAPATSNSYQGGRANISATTKQTQRNTKTSMSKSSTASKRNTNGGGEVSAFRNLQVAGDSIDLRLGTAAMTPIIKDGNSNFFDDNSLDGFDVRDNDDDQSEDSIALPLHAVAEELDEHTSAVTKLRIVPNKNIFLSASLDSTIRVWGTDGDATSKAVLDVQSFDSKAKKSLPATPRPVKFCGLWVDKSCDFIWGGCSDGIIRVWSGNELKPYRMMKGHDDIVTILEGAPLDHMTTHNCASASLDKTARVWDTRAKKAQCAVFRGHTDNIYSMKWLDGGRTIATASKDKTIKIWDVRTGR